jgi:PAS domain S-box-containing protein
VAPATLRVHHFGVSASDIQPPPITNATARDSVWALVEVVQRLSLARSQDEIQQIVRRAARLLTGADGATWILRDGDFCVYADEDAISPLWKGQRFPLDACVSGWVMLNRRPAVIPDIYADPRVPHEAYRPTFVKSLAMVPIRTADPVGAIGNYWAGQHHATDEEVQLLQALADSTAVALENVQALGELERQAHATAAFTFVGDGVVLVDGSGVVRSWNPAAERITGIAADAIVGRRIGDVLGGWDDVAYRVPTADAASATPRRELLPIRARDRELWLALSGTRFEQGVVYAFADGSADHTADRHRADSIATLSHELRTPLAAVAGAAATLRAKDGALDARQRSQLLQIIDDEAARLRTMLDEVLLASRLEGARELDVTAEPVDPCELASDVAATIRAGDESAVIDVVGAPRREPIALDGEKTSQVLRNLVENAVRYSRGGRVEVKVDATDDSVRFSVHDGGPGIAREEQLRIFDKFYRGTAATGSSGTGLGLYISRELVTRMGGRIWVDSDGGPGSTFVVELPTRQNAADDIDQTERPQRTYTVVVCDDQPGYRRLVAMALGLDGTLDVVAEAENGEQAITAVTEHRPDVLLLDVAMPVMDGLEALPQVVARSPRTKVVMLTGVINDTVRASALAAGAVRFLEKGIDPATLAEEVKAVAAGAPSAPVLSAGSSAYP